MWLSRRTDRSGNQFHKKVTASRPFARLIAFKVRTLLFSLAVSITSTSELHWDWHQAFFETWLVQIYASKTIFRIIVVAPNCPIPSNLMTSTAWILSVTKNEGVCCVASYHRTIRLGKRRLLNTPRRVCTWCRATALGTMEKGLFLMVEF